jgi:hypothetical protein
MICPHAAQAADYAKALIVPADYDSYNRFSHAYPLLRLVKADDSI